MSHANGIQTNAGALFKGSNYNQIWQLPVNCFVFYALKTKYLLDSSAIVCAALCAKNDHCTAIRFLSHDKRCEMGLRGRTKTIANSTAEQITILVMRGNANVIYKIVVCVQNTFLGTFRGHSIYQNFWV